MDRTISLVTGGNQRIGGKVCRQLAERGHTVVLSVHAGDCTGPRRDAATSTAPATATRAGTRTPRQHHDHNELQLPYQPKAGLAELTMGGIVGQ